MVKKRESALRGDARERTDQLDQTLRVLASRERRAILDHFIANETDTAELEVLSCKLARIEPDADDAESPSTEAAKMQLHHVHLPKLAQCDLVEYDPRSGTVRYHADDRAEAIVEFLTEL